MEFLTFKEVAEVFKVDELTVKSWVQRGQLPKFVLWKLPNSKRGTIRIIKSKLEEWQQNGCLQT